MLRTRIPLGVAAVLSLVMASGLGQVAGAPPLQTRSLNDGVFSQAQADRGLETWKKTCSECHQPEQFVGYLEGWVGLPVSYLFDEVAVMMPENNPGGLSREQYADVLAYVFSLNGVPAGDQEMGSDEDALEDILIEVPSGDDSDQHQQSG